MRTVSTFQRRMDLSSEPEAMKVPSGLQDSVDIPPRWPSKVCMSLPVEEFQTRIVASAAILFHQLHNHNGLEE